MSGGRIRSAPSGTASWLFRRSRLPGGFLGSLILNQFHLGIPPEFFQPVKSSGLPMKDMDDNVDVIEQNPLPVRQAFGVPRADADLMRPVCNAVRDGLHLNIGIGRTDDEEIGHVRQLPEIHDRNVAGFLAQRESCNSLCERLRSQNTSVEKCVIAPLGNG